MSNFQLVKIDASAPINQETLATSTRPDKLGGFLILPG